MLITDLFVLSIACQVVSLNNCCYMFLSTQMHVYPTIPCYALTSKVFSVNGPGAVQNVLEQRMAQWV